MTALRAVLAAVAFLTRIPVGRLMPLDGRDVTNAAPLFPVVGAGIAAIAAGIVALSPEHLSPPLAAALALAATALVTGALHLDALADTADSLGGATREDALRIMRDHTIGAYGATALICEQLVRFACLLSLVGNLGAIVVAGALGRAASVALGSALPYARATGGTGRPITDVGVVRAVAAVLIAVAIAVVFAQYWLLLAAGIGLVVAALWARRRYGGVTGDVLGACAQVIETACLLTAAVGG